MLVLLVNPVLFVKPVENEVFVLLLVPTSVLLVPEVLFVVLVILLVFVECFSELS